MTSRVDSTSARRLFSLKEEYYAKAQPLQLGHSMASVPSMLEVGAVGGDEN